MEFVKTEYVFIPCTASDLELRMLVHIQLKSWGRTDQVSAVTKETIEIEMSVRYEVVQNVYDVFRI